MALGADRRAVIRMIVREAMRLVAWGAALGGLGAFGITRVLSSMLMLYHESAADPAVIGGIAALLAVVALVAAWLPARRATIIDPMIALRSE